MINDQSGSSSNNYSSLNRIVANNLSESVVGPNVVTSTNPYQTSMPFANNTGFSQINGMSPNISIPNELTL